MRLALRGLGPAAVRVACCALLVFAVLERVVPQTHIDLYPSYVAGHLANEGQWDRIYHRSIWIYGLADLAWDLRVIQLTHHKPQGTSFVYHPWYLEFLRPIVANVSYPTFQAWWVILNKLCIVGVSLGIAALLGISGWPGQALISLAVGVASPTVDSIDHGQNVLLALVFSLAAAAAWRSRRTPLWVGGLFLALAWTCKPWCASLLGLCFVLRGLRAGALTALATGFVMVALPKLVLPAALMRDYEEMTLAMTSVSVSGHNNISLLASFERFFSSDWPRHMGEWFPRVADVQLRAAALGSTGALFCIGALLWWIRKPPQRYTVTTYLAFCLVPIGICWTHYFVFALPLAMLCSFDAKSPYLLRALGIVLLAVLLNLVNLVSIPPLEVQFYLVKRAPEPTWQALPIALIMITCLSALALSPSGRRTKAL
jgi:hypothetical protein